jgi:hypothetical protein
MISKLFWRYERSRSYPALARHAQVRRSFTYGTQATINVLTVPKCMDDAVWSLWSWMRVLEGKVTPRLFVDGIVTEEHRRLFENHFPGIHVHELRPWLGQRQDLGPQLRKLISAFPLGGKAALVAALSQDGPSIYSDSDILAFNRPAQLIDGLSGNKPLYMLDRYGSNYGPAVVAAVREQQLSLPDQVNSGLIVLPKNCVNLAALEDFLVRFSGWEQLGQSWFSEQTLVALMMSVAKGEPLKRDDYVVSLDRQFVFERDVDYRHIAVRHFTGPVRHVMYLKGIPFLIKQMAMKQADMKPAERT